MEVRFVIVIPGSNRDPASSRTRLEKSGIPGQARDDVINVTNMEFR
jgi:hypothetical protein